MKVGKFQPTCHVGLLLLRTSDDNKGWEKIKGDFHCTFQMSDLQHLVVIDFLFSVVVGKFFSCPILMGNIIFHWAIAYYSDLLFVYIFFPFEFFN